MRFKGCRFRRRWISSRSAPKKAAGLIGKTLKSAIANAENNADLRVDTLVVKEATIGEGPTFKRSQPKARGSAGPIRKRTSHIRIVLTDEIEIKTRAPKKKAGAKKTAARKPKAAKAEAPAEAKPVEAEPAEPKSETAE